MNHSNTKLIGMLFVLIFSFQLPIGMLSTHLPSEGTNVTTAQFSPDNKVVQFSEDPRVVFDITYSIFGGNVQMDITVENTLGEEITLFNLWIRVNKSSPEERILLSSTKIISTTNKLSLSTFDNRLSMIFHLKLYEGEVIDPSGNYLVRLSWEDTDSVIAQYDPELLDNLLADDIEAFLECSTEVEDPQLFPLIERIFYQEDDVVLPILSDNIIDFCVDFRVVNLMDSDLTELYFTYVKFKDDHSERVVDFELESPYLSPSNVEMFHFEYSDRIEYRVTFERHTVLEPGEWFKIKTKFKGMLHESTIARDIVKWSTGDADPFNFGCPFYEIGIPFYPVLSPGEPITTVDYDGDGLRNQIEELNDLDPYSQEPWLTWETLKGDHYVAYPKSADFVNIGGTVGIIIPSDFQGNELVMDVQYISPYNTFYDIQVNGEVFIDSIASSGRYRLANSATESVYTIKMRMSHDGSWKSSRYIIKFYIGTTEIVDLSFFFKVDSDGDGLIDDLERSAYRNKPDTDKDGIIDGSDVMPYTKIGPIYDEFYSINLPLYDATSEIGVNLQIQPTFHDFTEEYEYRGNKLAILPGIRIYGADDGGDFLPDNCFSIDDGLTGLINLIPLKNFGNEEPYSWARMLTYRSDNPAKNDNQISLKFKIIWLIIEYDTITEVSKILHVYDYIYGSFTIQGISVTENYPTNVALGLVDDGADYRDTGKNALLAAYLQVSDISYNPADIASLEMFSTSCNDLGDVNETRNELRNTILTQKGLDLETTHFIYLTYGYTVTYSLELLNDEFGYNPGRSYTPEDIDRLYSRPESTFFGIITTQILKGDYLEFVKQFTYGEINKTEEVLHYTLQFSKTFYCASGSNEIYHFNGAKLDEKNVWIYWFDFKEKENLIRIHTATQPHYVSNFPIFSIALSGPYDESLLNLTGVYDDIPILGDMFGVYLDKYENEAALGQIPVKLAEIGVFVAAILEAAGQFVDWGGRVGLLSKGMGAFSLIVGGLRLGYGIDQINQGAYKTGMAEVNRAVMSIYSGVLAFMPANPVTLTLTAIVLAITFADWIASLCGYDMWGELLEWCGLEDANPSYEITDFRVSYDIAKLKHQGSFRVGDQVSLYVRMHNTGNTKMWLRVYLGCGYAGDYGQHKQLYTRGGKYYKNYEHATVYDTFEGPYPITILKVYTELTWYYDEIGTIIVVAYPPFIVHYDPDPVQGGPYGNLERYIFDIPVMPETIGMFQSLMNRGTWQEESTARPPTTTVTAVKDEIIPLFSEGLEYSINVRNGLSLEQTFDLIGGNEDLWNYNFYSGATKITTLTLEGYEQKTIKVKVTPTAVNPLIPGNRTTVIRIQSQSASIIRRTVHLDYEIIPLYDFEVSFHQVLLDGLDLGGDDFLAYFINVTNTGNLFDNYTVSIKDLDQDLFTLYKPILSALPMRTDRSLVVFTIPWGKIVLPGEIPFEIEVRSGGDSSLIHTFNCILDIQEYHRMSFQIKEAHLLLTDSDVFNYELELTNLGNVEVPFTISWTNVSFATTSINQEVFTIGPGNFEHFNLTLTPFELGHDNFIITATTPYISASINASIQVIDDDILPPWFEQVYLSDNCHLMNASFLAFDEIEWHSDDRGIVDVSIFVDDILVHNYKPTPVEMMFNFSLVNQWIMQYGTHELRIEITDADNDRPNDSLTTNVTRTFEVTPDEMMEYILWELDELKKYTNDHLEYSCWNPLYNAVKRARWKVQWALDYFNAGSMTRSVFLEELAKASLELAEFHNFLLLKHDKILEEVAEYISNRVHEIRDHISLTMGAIVGTEVALKIADIIVDISQFADEIFQEYCLYTALFIDFHLWKTVDDLDDVLVLMSWRPEKDHLISKQLAFSICKLEFTRDKIERLVNRGCISEDDTLVLYEEIDQYIERIENL